MVPMSQEHHAIIGSENRVRIPGKILGSHPYLTNGGRTVYVAFRGDGHLGLFDEAEYIDFSNSLLGDNGNGNGDTDKQQMTSMEKDSPEAFTSSRLFHALTQTRKIATDGRLRLPDYEKYGFGSREVTIVASDGGVDIWDSAVYQHQSESGQVQPSRGLVTAKSPV